MTSPVPPSAALELPAWVDLVEVGLRDGLQSQPRVLATDVKLELLQGLLDAGVRQIQVASFVHPAKVPQMADAETLCALLPRRHNAVYSGLALNLHGVERAAAAGLEKVDVSLSASDSHGRRNAGMGLAQAEERVSDAIKAARALGLRVRGGVQCVFGCGAGSAVDVDTVVRLSERIAELGVEELALADSAGMANPLLVDQMVRRVQAAVGDLPLVLHLHDTRGLGLANLMAALRLGVTRFDTAFGGLGGCPFIPGASGNIATEDTAALLASMGVSTGIDVAAVSRVSGRAEEVLGAELPSKLYGLWLNANARQREKEVGLATNGS